MTSTPSYTRVTGEKSVKGSRLSPSRVANGLNIFEYFLHQASGRDLLLPPLISKMAFLVQKDLHPHWSFQESLRTDD